jgi:lysophospholipase L1-like esterase
MTRRSRIVRLYGGLAIFWLNTCLAVLLLNLGAAVYLRVRGASAARPRPTVSSRPLERVYPHLGRDEVRLLLAESAREIEYEPFTQFREKPVRGRFVNVDAAGFRIGSDQGPWPPDPTAFNVFLFGGSTTFCHGLADADTIGSHLQARLARAGLARTPRVYNFGRGAYYSSQERILFEKLVMAGTRPDVAVFIDGLNDFIFVGDRPFLTPWLEEFVERFGRPTAEPLRAILQTLPLSRALGVFVPRSPAPLALQRAAAPGPANVSFIDAVIRRYFATREVIRAVAAAHGVRPVFVWQPVPQYGYQPRDGGLPVKTAGLESVSAGYPRMAEAVAARDVGDDFVSCAKIHGDVPGVLYIDKVHYAPRMADLVAGCIEDFLRARGLLPHGAAAAGPAGRWVVPGTMARDAE